MDFFNKSTTQGDVPTVILGANESLIIPTPFTQWQELRIAACISLTRHNEYNADMNDYGIIGSSNLRNVFNYNFLFGLKKLKTFNPFSNENDVFWGLQAYRHEIRYEYLHRTVGSFSYNNFNTYDFGSDGAFWPHDHNHNDADSYSTYISIKYTKYENTVGIRLARSRDKTYTKSSFLSHSADSSHSNISEKIINNPNNDSLSVVCMYWPFFDARLRVHAVYAQIFS